MKEFFKNLRLYKVSSVLNILGLGIALLTLKWAVADFAVAVDVGCIEVECKSREDGGRQVDRNGFLQCPD